MDWLLKLVKKGNRNRYGCLITYSKMKFLFVIYSIVFISTVLFSCSDYEKLSQALANPKGVTKLKIRYVGLDSLPPEIGKLTDLKTLYLFKNGLKTIPPEIGNLKNLERLVISSNKIVQIPSTIGQLTKLEYLSLQHDQLISLPEEIGSLTNLKELYLDYNQLMALPNEIGNLTNLKFLHINNNHLQKLPNEIGSLSNLCYFTVGKNNLNRLPDEIGNLSNLIELNLVGCGPLVEIPATIVNCKRLENLYLDKTILLPGSIIHTNPRLKIFYY